MFTVSIKESFDYTYAIFDIDMDAKRKFNGSLLEDQLYYS